MSASVQDYPDLKGRMDQEIARNGGASCRTCVRHDIERKYQQMARMRAQEAAAAEARLRPVSSTLPPFL